MAGRSKKRRIRVDYILLGAIVTVLFGLVQFAIALPIAMNDYPGGTVRDVDTEGYSWNGNWISDVGRRTAWNGEPNTFGSWIFTISIIALGSSLIVFFVASHRSSAELDFGTFVITSCGAIASLGLIGIGLTPYDVFFTAHHVMLFTWIVPMFAVAAAFSYKATQTSFATGLVAITASLLMLAGVIFYALSSATDDMARGQKAFVIVSFIWFAMILVRVGMTVYEVAEHQLFLRQLVNEQAGDYMQTIQKGHRKSNGKS